jgi:predicted permease
MASQFFPHLLERVRGLPSVQSAALADVAPLGGARASFSTRDKDGRQTPIIDIIAVSPGYFATVGTSLLAGRDFGPADGAGGAPVAVVNTALARLLDSGRDVIGQQVSTTVGGASRPTIVGVVANVTQRELEAGAQPTLYVSAVQAGFNTNAVLLVRGMRDPAALRQPVRQVVQSIDEALPAPTFTTVGKILSTAVAPRRFSFLLLAIFALIAVALTAVGLYGVMAYLVADRTREMSVRLALGADPRRLMRLVVGQGLRLAIIGSLLGLVGSVASVGLLRHLLFGISVYDPWAFVAGVGLLGAVALLASWIPARRAAKIDAMMALRSE